MLARRLIVSGSGTAFEEPVPTWATLVAVADAGSLLQQNYPNAVYYNGVTYFGYNNGDNGNIEVRTYTHATGVTSSATVVDAALEIETHDPPSLLMRASDHKLMVFYMKHSAGVAYLKVATSAESIASFGSRVSLHTSLGAADYTYPSAHQLTGLANQPIYLFFRDDNTTGTPGTRASLCYSVSTNDGATWSSRTKVHAPTTKRPYWMVRSNSVDRIDVFISEDDRAFTDNVPGAHFYFDGTTWRGTAGSALSGSLPFLFSAFTEVYDGTLGSVDPMDIVYQSDGKPIVCWRHWKPVAPDGGTDSYSARWSGSAWISTLVETDSFGIVFREDTDPLLTAYTLRLDGSVYHVWRYRSSNYGDSWVGRVVYDGTTGDIRHISSIRDHGLGLDAIWDEGTHVSATDFDFGIRGVTG